VRLPEPAAADPIESFLERCTGQGHSPLGRLLAAVWRAALAALADGTPPDRARAALSAITIDDRPRRRS
jgi:hypothetical protein